MSLSSRKGTLWDPEDEDFHPVPEYSPDSSFSVLFKMTRKDLQVMRLKIKQGFDVYKKLCALNAEYQCLLGIQVIAGPFYNITM